MRVAYICADPGVPVFGTKGCSIHTQEVMRALRACGADLELFATRLDGDPPPALRSLRIHELPSLAGRDVAARERAALDANRSLVAALESAGPFDVVYERYSLWSFAGMEYARAQRVPGVLEVNAPLVDEQAEYRELLDRASAERVAERVFSSATVLLAVSEEIAAYLARYPGVRKRVHVIPNAVDPERFSSDIGPACPAPPGTFTVGFVGSFKAWHGLPVLIDAFESVRRTCPDTRLLLVGDGPERSRLLVDLSARGLLEAVHLTGRVAPHEVPGLLASMDVAVAPYPQRRHFYFSPLKVYEYMAAGLPVVASRIGQLRRLIDHGVTGLLCPPGDADALTSALEQLRTDPQLRVRIGRAARAKVLGRYTWEAVATRVLGLAATEMWADGRAPGGA
jgi:glycosyltransferase involved in cell wall biosynthesis